MNDLTQYRKVRGLMRPGDIVVFAGTQPISRAIDLFGGSALTHVGIIRQGIHVCPHGAEVMLSESTIEKGKSGAQTNRLNDTLANYGHGARAWWLPLSTEVRKRIDWTGFYGAIGEADGIVRYNVGGLFGFLARSIPILGPRICQRENQKQMVCSAYVTHVLKGAGILRGMNQDMVTPQNVAEMKLYSDAIQLIGTPGHIARFNTI